MTCGGEDAWTPGVMVDGVDGPTAGTQVFALSREPLVADRDTSWGDVTGAEPTPDGLRLALSEMECSSGRDPTPYLREPVVVEREDEVVVYAAVERPGLGDRDAYFSCQGTP